MIYLVGAPATGKSTVMAALRDRLGLVTGAWFKIWPDQHGEFRGEPLEDIVTGEVLGLSLGVTRPGFSGTDAIGMASHSEALRWAQRSPELPPMVLGEGRRLGTERFISAMAARGEVTLGYLYAEPALLDLRCQQRGSAQSEAFRKSSATMAANTMRAARDSGARVVEIDTTVEGVTGCVDLLLED